VAAGALLLTLVNLNQLYLRGFIPKDRSSQSGSAGAGLSIPEQPLLTVTRVDPKASFTPENTYFKRPSYQGLASNLPSKIPRPLPGMPADGRITRGTARTLLYSVAFAVGFLGLTETSRHHSNSAHQPCLEP